MRSDERKPAGHDGREPMRSRHARTHHLTDALALRVDELWVSLVRAAEVGLRDLLEVCWRRAVDCARAEKQETPCAALTGEFEYVARPCNGRVQDRNRINPERRSIHGNRCVDDRI